MESIVGAIIAGVLSLIGVVVTCVTSNSRITHEMAKNQAITDTRLEELTREVREHNNFARRVPVVEEQIKVINHRIDDLERKVS